MIINLPYPDMRLMPNRKNGSHWATTKKAKETAFNEAFYTTKSVMGASKFNNDRIALKITFVQSDKRKRDLDNLLASCKAYIDGIAKAIGVDDRHFDPITITRYQSEVSGTIFELTQNNVK